MNFSNVRQKTRILPNDCMNETQICQIYKEKDREKSSNFDKGPKKNKANFEKDCDKKKLRMSSKYFGKCELSQTIAKKREFNQKIMEKR